MKRLLAIAIAAALFALPASAQRGGSHGGISGSHGGGFSASRGGFTGGHGGFSAAPRPPSTHGGGGGFVRGGPPRFSGLPGGSPGLGLRPAPVRPPGRFAGPGAGPLTRPPQYVSHRVPYPGHGILPSGPGSAAARPLNGTSHRMPYHSPIADRRGGGDHGVGWDHRGRDRDRDGDHDGDRWRHRDRFGFYGVYGWAGYPYWPWWGWGYPFLNGWWDSPDDYDSGTQPVSNYAAAQYPEYAPGAYDTQAGEAEPQYEPWPYSQPAPSAAAAPAVTPVVPAEEPVTLVFKDGRPNEQIHNYLLTAKTLSVLDRNRRDIPVEQIDLAATEKANRDAGVEFSIPGGGR